MILLPVTILMTILIIVPMTFLMTILMIILIIIVMMKGIIYGYLVFGNQGVIAMTYQ